MKNIDGEWIIVANDRLRIIDQDNSSERMSILSNGNVGIGTDSPATELDVDGVITASGGTSSDWNTAYTHSQSSHFDGDYTNLTNIPSTFAPHSHNHDDLYYTEAETDSAISTSINTAIGNLVGGAPGALDTLNELAEAINDDDSYASSVTTLLAEKLPLAGGTLTGEHGVGLEKKGQMPLLFSPEDMDTMKRVRDSFAPKNLFNPGKIFPGGPEFDRALQKGAFANAGTGSYV